MEEFWRLCCAAARVQKYIGSNNVSGWAQVVILQRLPMLYAGRKESAEKVIETVRMTAQREVVVVGVVSM